MVLGETTSGGYSAHVEITLTVSGRLHRPAQVGPDFILFAEPVQLAAGPATLTICVDGCIHTHEIVIFAPAEGSDRVGFARAA